MSSSKKIRILAVADTNLSWAQEKIARGIPVRHHMWGMHELAQDSRFEIRLLPLEKMRMLKSLSNEVRGDLDQQLRLFLRRDFDVLFSTCHHIVSGLALLRNWGLFRKPIVTVLHTMPPGGRRPTMAMNGLSRIICLNEKHSKMLVDRFPMIANRVSALNWGWDATVPYDRRSPQYHLLAAGRTFRDYESFCKGLGETNADCTLVCPQAELGISIDDVPQNCRVNSGGNPWALQESEFSELILNAAAVAIPLCISYDQPVGLTSLLEAMAHGRAVLMTKNPFIDIDVEALGCGHWVAADSSAAWKAAIQNLIDNPDETVAMGLRGREAFLANYTIDRFAKSLGDQMIECIDEC